MTPHYENGVFISRYPFNKGDENGGRAIKVSRLERPKFPGALKYCLDEIEKDPTFSETIELKKSSTLEHEALLQGGLKLVDMYLPPGNTHQNFIQIFNTNNPNVFMRRVTNTDHDKLFINSEFFILGPDSESFKKTVKLFQNPESDQHELNGQAGGRVIKIDPQETQEFGNILRFHLSRIWRNTTDVITIDLKEILTMEHEALMQGELSLIDLYVPHSNTPEDAEMIFSTNNPNVFVCRVVKVRKRGLYTNSTIYILGSDSDEYKKATELFQNPKSDE